MSAKDERLVPRIPSAERCRGCANALKPTVVAKNVIERYNYSVCDAYRLKPYDVLWDNAECEMFKAETADG